MSLTVKEFMSHAPVTIGEDQPLRVAQELLRSHAIRHLPVQKGGQLVGVISERDIDFALRVDRREPSEILVRDAMTGDVFSVEPSASLREVAAQMASSRFGCAVIEEKGKLVGIFTTVDACRALAERC